MKSLRGLYVALSIVVFSGVSFSQTVKPVTADDLLIYERFEDPWNDSWGKKFISEIKVTKNDAGHVLHTSGNTTQIFDPKTFAMFEAINVMFDLNVKTDKKTTDFEKNSSWSVSVDRPYNTAGSCLSSPLNYSGKITSRGEEAETVQINNEKKEIKSTSVIWEGYWTSCHNGRFTRKMKFSPSLGVLTQVDYVFFHNNTAYGGYKLVLKEIKQPNK